MSDPALPGPTPLASKIAGLIAASGPISVSEYMTLCLADPEFGYYQTREPFGTSGDFITAPEVTQLFGEMIGIFAVHAWQVAGEPPAPRLVEFGPGRGTLMKDMLRVIHRLAPRLFETMTVHQPAPRRHPGRNAGRERRAAKMARPHRGRAVRAPAAGRERTLRRPARPPVRHGRRQVPRTSRPAHAGR
jgi:hypothetical protein